MAITPAEISPRCDVYFAGWKSDTWTLQRNGWEVAVNQVSLNYNLDRRLEILLFHPKHQMVARGVSKDTYHEAMRQRAYDHRRFQREYMNDNYTMFDVEWVIKDSMRISPQIVASFEWVDTRPSMIMVEEMKIFDLPLFKARTSITEDSIVVEPASIAEMLEEIRKRQAPDQARIRERIRKEKGLKTFQHATILTFGEAA